MFESFSAIGTEATPAWASAWGVDSDWEGSESAGAAEEVAHEAAHEAADEDEDDAEEAAAAEEEEEEDIAREGGRGGGGGSPQGMAGNKDTPLSLKSQREI